MKSTPNTYRILYSYVLCWPAGLTLDGAAVFWFGLAYFQRPQRANTPHRRGARRIPPSRAAARSAVVGVSLYIYGHRHLLELGRLEPAEEGGVWWHGRLPSSARPQLRPRWAPSPKAPSAPSDMNAGTPAAPSRTRQGIRAYSSKKKPNNQGRQFPLGKIR